MGIISKTKTLFWFLRRPAYYPHFFALLRSRLFGKKDLENTQSQSRNWCSARAITTQEFLKRFAPNHSWTRIDQEFPGEYKAAKQREEASPVKMGGGGNIDLLYNLCEFLQAKTVLETGVAYGWSSFAILLSIEHREGARLISTDLPYAKMNNEDFVGCVVPDRLKSKWKLVRNPDRVALGPVLKELGTIDLCHYDSDKSYAGRMFAYPKIWNALRTGGILVSDDIQDNVGFRDFCEAKKLEPQVISFEDKYVGVIIK